MTTGQSSINSEEKSLGSILSDKRPLRVPTYQRNFSWAKAQITDLWDDTQSVLYDNQDRYFLGSMVFTLVNNQWYHRTEFYEKISAYTQPSQNRLPHEGQPQGKRDCLVGKVGSGRPLSKHS
jgi:hypothetical protein